MFIQFLRCRRFAIPLSITFVLLLFPKLSHANPGEVNSTNIGQHITGGIYYNTPGDRTTFTNTTGTGLYISPSTTLIGREVSNPSNPTNSLTGNGGWLYFSAPGQVVRIDGRIDANALMNHGYYQGNGGKITVDSAYLYQNGQIYANGIRGGQVQFNVSSLTLGPKAGIYAQGQDGPGGIIHLGNINSHGSMDLQKGSIVDVSGKPIYDYDTSLITIQGGLINMEGILIANGKQSFAGLDGGTIALVANGKMTPIDQSAMNNASFMAPIRSNLIARDTSLIQGYSGWVRIGSHAQILSNGGDAEPGDGYYGGNGGNIQIIARANVENNGIIEANGGKGSDQPTAIGPTIFIAYKDIDPKLGQPLILPPINGIPQTGYHLQTSTGGTGGWGGDGGSVYFLTGRSIINHGLVTANGGNGGHGGNAIANDPLANLHYATGGDGGPGGRGGGISFIFNNGFNFNTFNINTLGHLSYTPGLGGANGTARASNRATPGQPGQNGYPGGIDLGTVYPYTIDCYDTCASNGGPIVPAFIDSSASSNLSILPHGFTGLFQQTRPSLGEVPSNKASSGLSLALGQNSMFLSRTYSPLSQIILNNAMNQYEQLHSRDVPDKIAKLETENSLRASGVTPEVASILLNQINNAKLKANADLLKILEEMSKTKQR